MRSAGALRKPGRSTRELHARQCVLVAEKFQIGFSRLAKLEEPWRERRRIAHGEKIELRIEIPAALNDLFLEFLRENEQLRIDGIRKVGDLARNEAVIQRHCNRANALDGQIYRNELDAVRHEIRDFIALAYRPVAKRPSNFACKRIELFVGLLDFAAYARDTRRVFFHILEKRLDDVVIRVCPRHKCPLCFR